MLTLYPQQYFYPHTASAIHLVQQQLVNALKLLRRPGISDILPHEHVIESQMKRCYNDCWRSAFHANRGFSSVFSAVVLLDDTFDSGSKEFIDIVQQMAEMRYYCVKMTI